MKYCLMLVLSVGTMHAMNQIVPVDEHAANTQGTGMDSASSTPSQSPLDDLEVIRQALQNVNASPHLAPYLAKHLRGKGDLEAGRMTNLIVQAANDALGAKHEEVTSRFTKKHTALITVGTTLIGAVITALASNYQSKC